MRFIKTAAICAMVALGVAAASATAASLITSANIKDGTIKVRDLSPSLQKKIKRAGKPGANGANGATGATGNSGANGLNGKDGKDGVRYDRLTGSCDEVSAFGEVSMANGVARLGVPKQNSWAQIRSYPQNLKLRDIKELKFDSLASDAGVAYLKITTEGHRSVLFSPNTQPGGERGLVDWVTHDVLKGTVRFDDDKGIGPDVSWSQMLDQAPNAQVKDVRLTAGCANPVGDDGGLVQVDQLKINNEVIDFN